MLAKKYSRDKKRCEVTFDVPAEANAQSALLVADFTEWMDAAKDMDPKDDGGFSVTVSLPAEHEYSFRYLLDNERWENDDEADTFAPNPFGTENSVLIV